MVAVGADLPACQILPAFLLLLHLHFRLSRWLQGGTVESGGNEWQAVVTAGDGSAVDHADDGDGEVDAQGVDEDEAEEAQDGQPKASRGPEWNWRSCCCYYLA